MKRWLAPPNLLVSILLVAAAVVLVVGPPLSLIRVVGAVIVGLLGLWGVVASPASRIRRRPRSRRRRS